jgi:hypothetical protein
MIEYQWKTYTIGQNIENKINTQAEDGWEVQSINVVGENVYVLYARGITQLLQKVT